MRKFLLIVFLITAFPSCNSKSVKDAELHKLVTLLIGSFSNKEQTERDASFAYLNLKNIRIWKDKPEYWIYSEVSDAKQGHYIYDQKIVSYERLDSSTIRSTSYAIINSKKYEENQKTAKFFDNLTLDSLKVMTGCQVFFKKKTSTIYTGKTNKGSCNSDIPYIHYVTSSYVISKDKISIWTKGFDSNKKQVWGKIKGPYKYKRLSNK